MNLDALAPGSSPSFVNGHDYFKAVSSFHDQVRRVTNRHLRTYEETKQFSAHDLDEAAQSALLQYKSNKENYRNLPLELVVDSLAISIADKELEPVLKSIIDEVLAFADEDPQLKLMKERSSLFKQEVEEQPRIIRINLLDYAKTVAKNFKPTIRRVLEPVILADQSKENSSLNPFFWVMNFIKA